jgi:hypothetical protein
MTTTTLDFAALTDATCGDACWAAREDICRCSCAGKNHGVTRSASGETPTRTRRVKANRYELLAVENVKAWPELAAWRMENLQRNINRAAHDAGLWKRIYSYPARDPEYPCILATASASNVKAWPELAAWRNVKYDRPLIAWIREDMAHLAN